MANTGQGYTGDAATQAADAERIEPVVVEKAKGKQSFVVVPKRWIVEHSFAWVVRCRRLLRDFKRLSEVLAGMHIVAFARVMLRQVLDILPALKDGEDVKSWYR